MLCVTMKVSKFVCTIGTNILFVASATLGFRLLVPFHLPITYKIICPFLTPPVFNVFSREIYNGVKIYHLLLFIWLHVAIIKIIKLYIDYRQFKCLLWALSKTSDNLTSSHILKETLAKLNLQKNVTVIVSEQVKHPFVVGLNEVFIALPLKNYSKVQLCHIISHELSHVRNCDFLWKVFFEFLSALYWWYPVVHIFKKHFFRLLEIRNDMKCIDGMTTKEQYSYLSCILEESANHETYSRFVLPFSTFNKSFLRQRFLIILNSEVRSNIKIQLFILFVFATLFILSVSISLAPIST